MQKIVLHSITLSLLTIFITLKVVNLHSLVHSFQDNTEIVDCGICDDFQKNSQAEFTSPADKAIEFQSFSIIKSEKDIEIYFYLPEFEFNGLYFNKPPPARA